MESAFTVQLFDLLVYLLPGLIILLAIFLFLKERFPTKLIVSEAKFAIVYVLLFSFFAGVLIHIASTGAMALYRRIVHSNYLHEAMNTFEDQESVKRIVTEKLHANWQKGDALYQDDLLYRYAEIVVHEKASHQSASVSRLMALSIFCRNTLAPVAFLALALFPRIPGRRRWYRWLLFSVAVFSIEFLLIQGMIQYRATAARLTFRTLIILYAGT